MKDFYDILFLAEHEKFNAQTLAAAISKTFVHRETDLNQAEYIFSGEFKANHTLNEMWTAFLKRSALDREVKFSDVIDLLKTFLSVARRNREPAEKWSPRYKEWK